MSETTNIRSISTMATWVVYDELVLLIRSLRASHPDIPLFILTQHKVTQQLAVDGLMDKHITIITGMEKFSSSYWKNKGSIYQCHLMAHKALVMKAALMRYPNTLFVDCDVLFLSPLPKIDETKDLGLRDNLNSYHVCQLDPNPSIIDYINNKRKEYRYTGAWIFVNHSQFPHKWWQAMHKIQDKYGADEKSLVVLTHSFSYFLFPITNHINTFSLITRRKYLLRLRQLKPQPVLSYRNKPIGTLHYHLLSQYSFNSSHALWLYLLYKSRSPWFDFINNYPGHFHYDVAELRKGCSFLFAEIIKNITFHRKRLFAVKRRQLKYKESSIYYSLLGIYKYLILPYYLIAEIFFFHHIIHKSEFTIPKWKLFIITFGWTYRLLGTRYRKSYPHPQAKLNK